MRGIIVVAATVLVCADSSRAQQCCGDCNGDGTVAINELVTAVNRALGSCADDGVCDASVATCAAQLSACQDALNACPALPGQRLKTGQTACWDASGTVIACAGSGQDGELQKGLGRSYVDNGDGTVTDTKTGLMWEKLSNDGSIHDQYNSYTWVNALAKASSLNTAMFAGHNDWRLPNRNELESIVNLGVANPSVDVAFNTGCVPSCAVTNCSCTPAFSYWSSTSAAPFLDDAWVVEFFGGGSFADSKSTVVSARAVRDGP